MTGFEAALLVLPGELRACAARLTAERETAWEFRLRRGRLPSVVMPGGERPLPGAAPVTAGDLDRVVELAACASPYAVRDSLGRGFLLAPGGVRVGLCGQVNRGTEGERTIGPLSSAAVRIPREVKGCAAPWAELPFRSTLILSPPGGGKTTLLRDMVRLLSLKGKRVALCDERGEVAGFARGENGFDVGERTDVMTGCAKSEAAMMLLRSMNPEIIAMDEITAPEDAAACAAAANCGVALLATAHGDGPEDLAARPLYRTLREAGIFRRAIVIVRRGDRREYREAAL